MPTWLGETVNELMVKHFPEIVDVNFTADMERRWTPWRAASRTGPPS